MNKKNILILFILLSFFIISYFIVHNNLRNQEGLFSEVKKIIPNNMKSFLLETVFVFKKKDILLDEINVLKQELKETKAIKNKYAYDLSQVPNVTEKIGIKKIDKNINLKIGDNKFVLEKFKTLYLNVCKHEKCKSGTAYIDFFDKNFFIASAYGIFGYTDSESFDNKNFLLKVIKSNITDLVKYDLFYKTSPYGIKDMLIHRNKLYISLSYELKSHCFNTSILYADLNYNELKFEEFFVPKTCVGYEFANFNPHHSGGRLFPYNDEEILFSSGEYKKMVYAQNPNNVFGKIIKININSKKYEIISMGHRNPQGLFYDIDDNIIFSTDHGPQGGDEVNFANLNQKKLYNFGWPISSYGDHYGISKDSSLYKEAPLYKSHEQYGFNEPLKYFEKGIGISQILSIPKNFNKIEKKQILVASMGDNLSEGDLSLHHFVLNDNFSVLKHKVIPLNERIRDLIYVKELNKVFLYFESSGSIGILQAQ